ncbi:MAG: hypothetical protein HY243_00955 [Proteobacteria bacterium]|nr:hypothetical protein [Pseudomonadota bacterium]
MAAIREVFDRVDGKPAALTGPAGLALEDFLQSIDDERVAAAPAPAEDGLAEPHAD